jgi:isopenicillin N synthase-like dioxygenase
MVEKEKNIDVSEALKFSLIKNNDNETIKKLSDHLMLNGWCFIDLEENKIILDSLIRKMSSFFDYSLSEKASYKSSYILGYDVTNIKEVIRWLSNDKMNDSKFPSDFQKEAKSINEFYDSFFKFLISEYSQQIFGIKISESNPNEVSLFTKGQEFGMIDFVNYFPKLNKEKIKRNELVPEHVDPGLFAFSIFSDVPGLEMFSYTTSQWIKVPLNYGVLWTGLKAVELSNRKLKGGLHRVCFNEEEKKRLTLWYEVNTLDQVVGIDGIKEIRKKENSSTMNKLIHTNKDKLIKKNLVKTDIISSKKIIKDSKISDLSLNSSKTSSTKASVITSQSFYKKKQTLPNTNDIILKELKKKPIVQRKDQLKIKEAERVKQIEQDNINLKLINSDGKISELKINLDVTILQLKRMIEFSSGISMSKSKVSAPNSKKIKSIGKSQFETLDQSLTLRKCEIKDGDTLYLNLEEKDIKNILNKLN